MPWPSQGKRLAFLIGMALGAGPAVPLPSSAAAPGVSLAASWADATRGENLASGARVRASESPHYPEPAAGWAGRLNDGRLALLDRTMWTSAAAVGWREVDHVVVTLDLGSVRPVGRVAVRVLGGRPQIHLLYPRVVTAWLSEDGRRFEQATQALRERDFPPERGDASVANLVLHVRGDARYVALHFELGVNFLFIDEIAVLRDDEPPPRRSAAATSLPVLHSGVVAFPDKREWVISTPPFPTFLTILSDGARSAPQDLAAYIDVPEGVRLEGADSIGDAPGSPGQHRYRTRISHPHRSMAHVSRPLFLRAERALAPDASVQITPLAAGARSLRFPLREIRIPATPVPRKLHVSLAWLQANLLPDWPDLAPRLRAVGFNAVGVFPQYWPREVPSPAEVQLIDSARDQGMDLIYNDSPFHVMVEKAPGDSRYRTQRPDGSVGPGVSPCYRGSLYRDEIRRIERLARLVRPQWVFFDTELWAPGTREADTDRLCREQRARGLGGAELREALGAEIATDLRTALERAVPAARARAGLYAVDPTRAYQGLFAFQRLFPRAMDLAMPSLYVGGDPLAVQETMRAIHGLEPEAAIVPWLTAGAQGEFPSARIRGIALEAFFNGAKGITYYLAEDFDTPEDFAAHARAITFVANYEDYFTRGREISSVRSASPLVAVSARELDERRLVLVGSYRARAPLTAEIETGCAGAIRDAESGAPVRSTGGTAHLRLAPAESIILVCKRAGAEGQP